METENFSGLRDVNRKISCFLLYRNYPGIPVYATNFRIIPFPKWKFFPEKWKPYLQSHLTLINCDLIEFNLRNLLFIFFFCGIYIQGIS